MKKVWVIMGNDFPECAFDSEAKADAYVAEKKEEERLKAEKKERGYGMRIYWRHYEFELK
jgi:hypothetical protein